MREIARGEINQSRRNHSNYVFIFRSLEVCVCFLITWNWVVLYPGRRKSRLCVVKQPRMFCRVVMRLLNKNTHEAEPMCLKVKSSYHSICESVSVLVAWQLGFLHPCCSPAPHCNAVRTGSGKSPYPARCASTAPSYRRGWSACYAIPHTS